MPSGPAKLPSAEAVTPPVTGAEDRRERRDIYKGEVRDGQ
jgi:hypothetical protein